MLILSLIGVIMLYKSQLQYGVNKMIQQHLYIDLLMTMYIRIDNHNNSS